MSDQQPEVLKPLKTWSHLAGNRRRPSEYEIVSTNLHYFTDNPENPWELDPNIHMSEWYRNYCFASPLKHDDWNAFRDPDQLVYRTYNLLQDGQESYVQGLFEQFSDRGHDQMLLPEWADMLVRLYTPARYLFHALQMGSAYLHQMAPASTITNCATYETADHLRWLTHTAYRTRELANAFPNAGFGGKEREMWENDPAWQGFRELMEKALVTWDWAEAFTAINVVAKPAIEEAVLVQLGDIARVEGDTLLGLLTQAQMRDAERHRRWSAALIRMALEKDGNREVLQGWVDKWAPLANSAIDAYCSALPDGEGTAEAARQGAQAAREAMGL
ncbi:aromatic/alkene monooxygenase hydroxylase subunit beta [Thiolapillus brandeum]|uniref:Toluene-4-monooxygenase system protein E n=1 Tax=Thiolapillus brandeum TaxID=1076588 RepID=A0A7U6JHJ4_9GAMM|nr:aromatic/alkene monooxygenase hydroxylase subunit beta [Thiolapillus brandeum]BAO43852.1 toluene-4-monooxygenase system protein E [Thiolapillus brandeum]